jgi:16S rRNA (uracil1498-N3)-methyltransferase
MHRFIRPIKLFAGRQTINDRGLAHQLRRVLHLRVGEKIILCDGAGQEVEAEILSLSDRVLEVKMEKLRVLKNEPVVAVSLYVAMLKQEHFSWVLQKAVECGAKKIVPLETQRTVKTRLNLERAQRVVLEAAEQSGRGIVPEVTAPISLSSAFFEAVKNEANFFFAPEGKKISIKEHEGWAGKTIGAFVGPEGGWASDELAAAARVDNLEIVNLGSLVLRAETAATVATFMSSNLLF